jgi:hypothetical protein
MSNQMQSDLANDLPDAVRQLVLQALLHFHRLWLYLDLLLKPVGKIPTALSSWNGHWVIDKVLELLQRQII